MRDTLVIGAPTFRVVVESSFMPRVPAPTATVHPATRILHGLISCNLIDIPISSSLLYNSGIVVAAGLPTRTFPASGRVLTVLDAAASSLCVSPLCKYGRVNCNH